MMDFNKTIKSIRHSLKKHSPEILTGIGIAGMITTTIMAVKATPKALQMIDDIREEQDIFELDQPIKPTEVIKATWKCYIPAALVGCVSIGCLIGASNVNLRRNAALATAYALSESTLKEYQDKVTEKFGKRKEQEVRDDIAKDKVEQNPVSKSGIVLTGNGDIPCFDKLSGRYFMSNVDKLKKAENELDRQMRYDMYVSLNEFYDAIGLDHIDLGDHLGWNIDRGYIELSFSSQLDENDHPCLVVDHKNPPTYEFSI